MNTTNVSSTKTATANVAARLILAIDLGKYKSVACIYGGDPALAEFRSFTTDREHVRKLVAKVQPSVVVIDLSQMGKKR